MYEKISAIIEEGCAPAQRSFYEELQVHGEDDVFGWRFAVCGEGLKSALSLMHRSQLRTCDMPIVLNVV